MLVTGQFTASKFARADIYDAANNQHPSAPLNNIPGLTEGPSHIVPAKHISIPKYDHKNPKLFDEFIAIMEGQWEGRDTNNADLADAVVGFLKFNPQKDATEKTHDGTKATLNIFAQGRYAHPLNGLNEFDIKAEHRSNDIVMLDSANFVGYKRYEHKNVESLTDFTCNKWEETTNGRFKNVPSNAEGLNPDWKKELIELAKKQHDIGKKGVPILAIWGVDDATDKQLEELKRVTATFLSDVNPENVMITGKRDKVIADRAENILKYALSSTSPSNLRSIITGGADGVDSVALRLVATSE